MKSKTYEFIPNGKPWQPGWVRRIPFGLLSLFFGIISMALSAVVLRTSDGKEINTWPSSALHRAQPSVFLSVLAACANTFLRFSLSKAVSVTWWDHALKGTTLEDLHHAWSFGSSLQASVFSGRNFNLVALASIISSIIIIDGPLLQQASTVITKSYQQTTLTTAALSADFLPSGFSTSWGYSEYDEGGLGYLNFTGLYQRNFSQVVQGYTARSDIKLNHTGCRGTCSMNLEAEGFDVNCQRGKTPYNLSIPDDGTKWSIPSTVLGYVKIAMPVVADDAFPIAIYAAYKEDESSLGNLTQINCTMRPARVTYPVVLSDGTVTLQPAGENDTIKIKEVTDKREIGGIFDALRQLFNSTVTILGNSDADHSEIDLWYISNDGTFGNTYLTSNDNNGPQTTWADPTPDIISTARELMFRTAVAASNASTTQTANSTDTFTRVVYQSHYQYFAAAMAVIVANAVVVCPLFVGFHHMGRNASMSPLELARAFQSPLTAAGGSNDEVPRLLGVLGKRRVRYGEVWQRELDLVPVDGMLAPHGAKSGDEVTLDSGIVTPKTAGLMKREDESGGVDDLFNSRTDLVPEDAEDDGARAGVVRRLGFADADAVAPPKKGVIYF
ncbi:hypothetical protein IWZ03DRAFT_118745 [Phyllosticta citriasiana]|uniref:Uncharacterized protein n=1 Tax=Phyllosticta citriasiana TaxID=595635 RepID=A0ABR1KXQ6_9PEZI